MNDLVRFRDHCRKMAKAEHRPECASLRPEPYWQPWALVDDGLALAWRGPKPAWQPAPCDCHLSDDERALFDRLAGEVDAYLNEPLWPIVECACLCHQPGGAVLDHLVPCCYPAPGMDADR